MLDILTPSSVNVVFARVHVREIFGIGLIMVFTSMSYEIVLTEAKTIIENR